MMLLKIRLTTRGGAMPNPGNDSTREPSRCRVALLVQSRRHWSRSRASRFVEHLA